MPIDLKNRDSLGESYASLLGGQYQLYVEMADRISARRMLANSFFVGVNTALIAALTIMLKNEILVPDLLGFAPFAAVLLMCGVWWRLIKSYRQLNSAKFQIIHALEQALPADPYTAEWMLLDKGHSPQDYLPLTHVESWVPWCFALLYVFLAASLF